MKKNQELCNAIKSSSTPLPTRLIQDPDVDCNKAMALHFASSKGHDETVAHLLKRIDIDVNKTTTKHGTSFRDGVQACTSLYLASSAGHTKIVEQLLSHSQINVNKVTSISGYTALYQASIYGHSEIVGLLLAHPNIQVNLARMDNGSTPLVVACQKGCIDVVRRLLTKKELDVNNVARGDRMTPLFFACQDGYVEIALMLLSHPNIDVNRARDDGFSPLLMAIKKNHPVIVKHIVQHCNFNLSQQSGSREVCTACVYGSVECAKLLVWAGADPSGRIRASEGSMLPQIRVFATQVVADHAAFVEFVLCCFGARRSADHSLYCFGSRDYSLCLHQIESYLAPCNAEAGHCRTAARRGLLWLKERPDDTNSFRQRQHRALRADAKANDHQIKLNNLFY